MDLEPIWNESREGLSLYAASVFEVSGLLDFPTHGWHLREEGKVEVAVRNEKEGGGEK